MSPPFKSARSIAGRTDPSIKLCRQREGLITLAIYYGLPFIRWDRGPGAPDQAALVDFPNRRFYFFFIELWPQEIYYFTMYSLSILFF